MLWKCSLHSVKSSSWSRSPGMTPSMSTPWAWSPPSPCCLTTPSQYWMYWSYQRVKIHTHKKQENMASICMAVQEWRHSLSMFWISWKEQIWPPLKRITTNHVPSSNTRTGGIDSLDSLSSLETGKCTINRFPVSPHTTDLPDCQPWTRETGNWGGKALLLLFGWRHCLLGWTKMYIIEPEYSTIWWKYVKWWWYREPRNPAIWWKYFQWNRLIYQWDYLHVLWQYVS